MKNINLYKVLYCLVLTAFFSCETDNGDTVFDESPAIRIANQISDLKTELLSQSQGYKGIYFTKNDEFGGWTFHMKFNADETVVMTSDVDGDTDLQSSRYAVRLGTSVELAFTTNNHIHKLSEASGAMPSAFGGNSVFQFISKENGVITFKELRSSGIFVLRPTGYSDFETESVASANQTLANRAEFQNTPLATAFTFLSIVKDGVETTFDLNYNAQDLFANPSTFNAEGLVVEENFGIAFTETGIVISPALEFEGVVFEEFTLDTSSGFQYVATIDGVTATIGYSNVPATPLDFYEYGAQTAGVFNMDERFKSSAGFNNFYTDYEADLDQRFELQITDIILWNLRPTDGQSFLQIRTNGFGRFDFDFNGVQTNGITVFTLTGDTSPNVTPFIATLFAPIINEILGGSSGYYTVNAGNYLNFSNRTFSLINVDDPSRAINFWTF